MNFVQELPRVGTSQLFGRQKKRALAGPAELQSPRAPAPAPARRLRARVPEAERRRRVRADHVAFNTVLGSARQCGIMVVYIVIAVY